MGGKIKQVLRSLGFKLKYGPLSLLPTETSMLLPESSIICSCRSIVPVMTVIMATADKSICCNAFQVRLDLAIDYIGLPVTPPPSEGIYYQ